MKEYPFALIPFPNEDTPPIEITGQIGRNGDLLTVHYGLTGNVELILFPQPVSHPGRKQGLWLGTCFEFFLARPGQPQYWEFNLSPSGEWNCFRMDAYRRIGFREDGRISEIRLPSSRHADGFHLEAIVDLSPLVAAREPVQVGVTSVIQTPSGQETYWALAHPSQEADFHLRDSFTLVLEGTDRL